MKYGNVISLCAAVTITAGGLFVLAPPAFAKTPTLVVTAPADIVVRHISYADLNLASAPGERTLNRRVGSAVASLCDEAVGEGYQGFEYMSCKDGAWRGARPQISLAVQRAHEMAVNDSSSIAAVAITISLPQ